MVFWIRLLLFFWFDRAAASLLVARRPHRCPSLTAAKTPSTNEARRVAASVAELSLEGEGRKRS
jgi:hypothetical protein